LLQYLELIGKRLQGGAVRYRIVTGNVLVDNVLVAQRRFRQRRNVGSGNRGRGASIATSRWTVLARQVGPFKREGTSTAGLLSLPFPGGRHIWGEECGRFRWRWLLSRQRRTQ